MWCEFSTAPAMWMPSLPTSRRLRLRCLKANSLESLRAEPAECGASGASRLPTLNRGCRPEAVPQQGQLYCSTPMLKGAWICSRSPAAETSRLSRRRRYVSDEHAAAAAIDRLLGSAAGAPLHAIHCCTSPIEEPVPIRTTVRVFGALAACERRQRRRGCPKARRRRQRAMQPVYSTSEHECHPRILSTAVRTLSRMPRRVTPPCTSKACLRVEQHPVGLRSSYSRARNAIAPRDAGMPRSLLRPVGATGELTSRWALPRRILWRI